MKTQRNQQPTNLGSFAKVLGVAVVALILAIAMLSALPASAQTITSGSFQLYSSSGGVFTLTGANTALHGFIVTGGIYVTDGYQGIFCNPCGNPLHIFAGGSGLDFIGGTARTWLPPVLFPSINWGSQDGGGPTYLFFDGPDIPLSGPGVYTGPFNYSAALCGQNPGTHHSCDFTAPPQGGSGHVVVHIAQDPNTGFLYTTGVTYLIP
jgi:hypothetical protein